MEEGCLGPWASGTLLALSGNTLVFMAAEQHCGSHTASTNMHIYVPLWQPFELRAQQCLRIKTPFEGLGC